MSDPRDILSGREDVPEVPCLCRHSVLGKEEDPTAESAALETVIYTSEQGPGALPPTVPATTASPAATTATITTASIPSEVLTEGALALVHQARSTRQREGQRQMVH